MNTNQLPDFYDIIPDKYKEKIIYDTVTEKEINSFKEYVPLNWIFGLKYKSFLKNLTDDVKKYASDSTDFFAETINMYFNNQLIEYRFIDVGKTRFEAYGNHFYDFCRSNFETVFIKSSFRKFFVVKKDDFENIRTAYLLDEDYEFDLFCLINFHNRGFGTELLSVYNEYNLSNKTQSYNDFCLSIIGKYCEVVFDRNSHVFKHSDFLNISNNFVQKKFSIKELTKDLPSEFLDFVLPKTDQTSFVERTMTTEELPF